MSILTEQQRKAFRGQFIGQLSVTLRRLRIASEEGDRNILFGKALGETGVARDCKLIGWEEYLRLNDLALSASNYSAREARARSEVTP